MSNDKQIAVVNKSFDQIEELRAENERMKAYIVRCENRTNFFNGIFDTYSRNGDIRDDGTAELRSHLAALEADARLGRMVRNMLLRSPDSGCKVAVNSTGEFVCYDTNKGQITS